MESTKIYINPYATTDLIVTDDTLSILLMKYCEVMDVVPEFLWKPVARHLAKANSLRKKKL